MGGMPIGDRVYGRCMRAVLLLLVGALVMVVASCSEDDGEDAAGAAGADLEGTSWTLDTLGGQPPVSDGVPTLEFAADGTVSGSTGCNRYAGTYEADGDRISIEIGPLTLAACSAELDQQQQAALLDAFAATASFSGGGESFLELADANGELLATFAPPEP